MEMKKDWIGKGKELQVWRKKLQFSRSELALKLGLRGALSIGNWERNKSIPSGPARALLAHLGFSPTKKKR